MLKKILTICFSASLLGCSVYSAIHAPDPVEYKDIKLGESRLSIITKMGTPKMSETNNEVKTDLFEFTDGYGTASKSRVILYIAGDVFTLTLAELIFWPLEENAFDGKQCRGRVVYDRNDKVIDYEIVGKNGEKLWSK